MDFAKAIVVYLLTTLKFIAGPTGGYLAGLNIFATMFVTISGMMTSVVLFTYFGKWMKRRFVDKLTRNRRQFTKKRRRTVRIYRRWGAFGIAMLTPILLMPIGGTIIMVSFNSPKKKIITYMLFSAVFWTTLECILIYTYGEALMEYLYIFIPW